MEELIKDVAKKIDDQLDFKKIIGGLPGQAVEWFDRKIAEGALSYSVSKVPEEYKPDVEALFNAYLTEDYEALTATFSNRINYVVNLPGLDESEESIVFEALSSAFLKIIQKKLTDEKEAV